MVSRAVSPVLQRRYGDLRVIEISEVRSGGEETEVLPSLTGNAFALVSKGIYFGEPNSDGSTSIQFFSFTTGKVITVTTIKRHGYRPVHFAGRKVHSLHASQSRQQQPDASG